ncbi:MAG: cytochrome c3 family protein [Magnetococcales bacterium]|nr:cytochrome c3 family protein [Magnetococcales bacterium]NGZ26209.1 cytochrome c3 family protein [Magnetococcales bacterium]
MSRHFKYSPVFAKLSALAISIMALSGTAWGADGETYPTRFTNIGGITNTRHNLTQSPTGISNAMMTVRNNYGEVCVYCHTPHGANENIAAPLWNRTFKNNTYTTYENLKSSTITQVISQPGPNSLTCLSCHDGTVAIDSIVNMPGSGRYSEANKTSHQESFLDAWPGGSAKHVAVGGGSLGGTTCMSCHTGPDGSEVATDFTAFYIGTDLSNDHPVGIVLPEGRIGVDFADPGVRGTSLAYYDRDADNKADSNEIRFYKTGGNYKVECASCHDPHGVPSGGEGSVNNPSFLRVNNQNSAVCLTCHDK